jgi:DNA-binding protein H-NS
MTKTYAQVMKQIDALSKEAERLKRQEVDGVIARIKDAIAAYGLTAADLGLGAKRGPKPGFKRKKAAKAVKAVKGSKPVRFRDDAGNTWVGRGPRPKWLRDALAAGKKLEDFAV